jgi:murein DD-endopeptidase MepM/ murein hydrolase activator NlpD
MYFFAKKLSLLLVFILISIGISSQVKTKTIATLTDSTNIYNEILNDKSDDLMEDHPADDIYNNIWTPNKLNPYKVPIDSLPDTVRIDCSEFLMPIEHAKITSNFGPRRYRYHYGTDLKLQIGDSVRSTFSGKVRIIDYESRGYGHYVVVRHNNGLETVYAHLSKVLVSLDQEVKTGETIALGGNTGRSTGPHLHFETRFLGNAINPASIINFDTGMPKELSYLMTKSKTFYYQREVKAMAAAKYIKVKKGDNLGRIAINNGTSVRTLCRLNNIKSTKTLQIGQRIRVR